MMKFFRGTVFGLALALAFGAFAEATVEEDAKLVTRGWFSRNRKAFGDFGAVQKVLAEKDDQGDVLWYVVVMDGGAVVVSPDTEIEPVLAVVPGCDGTIPEGSPLRAMLKRDLARRLAAVRPNPVRLAAQQLAAARPRAAKKAPLRLKAAAPQQAAPAAGTSNEAAKWARLKRYATLKMLTSSGNPATIVRWLDGWNSANKVGNVQTLRFWNQDSSPYYFKNPSVFDYYTPNHYVCGCVATAGSAIMHYFRAPSGNVVTKTCYVDGNRRDLTTQGGAYDWSLIDNLNLVNGKTVQLSDEAVKLLGRVASDCGIGCEMSYAAEGSGTTTSELQWSFRNVFGVSHAQFVTKNGGMNGGGAAEDLGSDTYANIIYNQIRGGAPVSMGIDGHEVVACGYGIDADQTDYTYVFLGWGGANDAWYALPNIDTKATAGGGWYTSTFIDEVVTEISFDDRYIPVVGRLVDIDGNPLAGEVLTMANGEKVTTDANGYWGTRVAPTDECYVLDPINEPHEYVLGELAKSTTDSSVASAALAAALPDAMEICLLNPTVIVYDGETVVSTNGSIDRAVESARNLANPRLEVIDRTVLRKPCEVDFNCTICATNVDPVLTPVLVSPGACLTVAAGVQVRFTNVVFQAQSEEGSVLSVAAGGKAVLAEAAAIDSIKVADAVGLELAGPVGRPMLVDAPETASGAPFAVWTCGQSVAEACAYFFLNLHDDELGGIATADGQLIWGNAPVPEAAVAVRLTQGDDPVNYRSFAALLNHYLTDQDAAIEICKDCKLNAKIRIDGEHELSLFGPSNTVTVSGNAGFEVLGASRLVVSNLNLTGKVEDSMFVVGDQQGSTGELVFGDGAVATNVVSRSKTGGGVAFVYGGGLRMEEGSLMTGCRAGSEAAVGGAVYVGPNTTFELAGGVITNCFAASTGGGVFVVAPATVNLSGSSAVCGNVSGENPLNDNLHFSNAAWGTSELNLVGRLTGENGFVGIRYDLTGALDEEGDAFANIGDGVSAEDAAASAPFFLNEAAPGDLVASASEDGKLVWIENPNGLGGCEPELAAVRVVYPNGVTNWYEHVATALDNLRGACDLELLTNDEFACELKIAHPVTLRSSAETGETFVLERVDVGKVVVQKDASLTISNAWVSGIKVSDGSLAGAGWGNLIAVEGGELTLKSGATVGFVFSDPGTNGWTRACNAITVYDGGHLTMERGTLVSICENVYFDGPADVNSGVGGGILIDTGSTADFRGGQVTACAASRGGGVAVANKSMAYVSGDFTVTNNFTVTNSYNLVATENNLVVEDLSSLVLAGDFTGSVGISEGVDCDTNVFGKVDAAYYGQAGFGALTNGAANFTHDARYVRGVVATNGTDTALLVWADAFAEEGGVLAFTDKDGSVYGALGELPPPVPRPVPPPEPEYTVTTNTALPIAFSEIVRISEVEWQLVVTDLVEQAEYALSHAPDLKTAFTTGAWFRATSGGTWTTNVIFQSVQPASFWRAHGRTTYVTNWIEQSK